jgi:hypothetical protein
VTCGQVCSMYDEKKASDRIWNNFASSSYLL